MGSGFNHLHEFKSIISSQGSPETIALFFFGAIAFAAPFSGAHINPAVTLAMLLGRKINFGVAIIYWLSQFSGAFCGAFISYLILNMIPDIKLVDNAYNWVLADFFGETLATFVFILFIMI